MDNRFSLLAGGLFPETLPPCFDSHDSKRAFHGIIRSLDADKFKKRTSEYIRYSGTKHDRSRRFFGTPNIISYFHVSTFIHQHWAEFDAQFAKSAYSIGAPVVLDENDDRAIKVPSLSELSHRASKEIAHAPVILKTDIAQFFPSIYTHALSWAAHGRDDAKKNTRPNTKGFPFNDLDKFVRDCQSGQTRGVLVGPDAFRLVAEFISAAIDVELEQEFSKIGIGAIRHVDDYYFGLETEADALVVLSQFREVLAKYELQLNDPKTAILSSLEPINELWAQRTRNQLRGLRSLTSFDDTELVMNEALETARQINSDSPIKMFLRRMDELLIYNSDFHWEFLEPYLQRIAQAHPHALDYVCLLVGKRSANDGQIDDEGWASVASSVMEKCLALNHHHEIVWMLWLALTCEIELADQALEGLDRCPNDHVKALMVQAHVDGRIDFKPRLPSTSRLATAGSSWLSSLVAKAQGFSGAKFSGEFTSEFAHLADRNIKLIDIDKPMKTFQQKRAAISRSRYGYDDDEDESEIGEIGFLGDPFLDVPI